MAGAASELCDNSRGAAGHDADAAGHDADAAGYRAYGPAAASPTDPCWTIAV